MSRIKSALALAIAFSCAGGTHAATLIDFTIYAQRNVIIGGSTTVTGLVGAGTGVVDIGDGTVASLAGIYGDLRAGDDITLNNNAFVTGTCTNPGAFTVGSGASCGAHVIAMPDLPALPGATVYSAGVTDQSVGNNATLTLAPGSWRNISLGGGATLNLTAGDYYLNTLTAGNSLTLNVALNGGDLNLYLVGAFSAGGILAMTLTGGGDWQNVSAETHGTTVNAFLIGGGGDTEWKGTVFTPNGGIHLGGGSGDSDPDIDIQGYLWAGLDVDLEHGLEVVIPVPAAVWLLGSALGLLGWVRRRSA